MTASQRPAAEGLAPGHYPPSPVEMNHTAPVPRRIRAVYDGVILADSVRATYVWEHPYYPQFYFPADDIDTALVVGHGVTEPGDRGPVTVRDLGRGDRTERGAVRYLDRSSVEGLSGTYRFEWSAVNAWFEEDEEIYVHPRSPYVRVDALRSNRPVRVEKDGVVLAEAATAVALFETGLPTRWYLDPTSIDWCHMVASPTRSQCPYKGTTSDYWSVRITGPDGSDTVHRDLAWGYRFPTRQVQPIAGLVCFFNDKVDIMVDGVIQ